MTQLSTADSGMAASPYVKDITPQNFMQEVIQASLQMPVLVYFTASWCGPCKQFGPLLEKVVNEAKCKVKLARVDVDKNPQIAQQFRVQSVPMVYVMLQGQPLDAFAGAVPESQLRQMIAQLANAAPQSEATLHSLEEARKLLQEGNPQEAFGHFMALLGEDEANMDALAGAANCLIALGQLDKAGELLAQAPEASIKHEAIISAKAALELARNAPSRAELLELNARLAKDENDHEARCQLAAALFASGEQEAAIAELLQVVARDKNWNEGAARAQLLSFFEALGHSHPLTMQGRRKLSSLLFS